jgi:hypothetical protein
LVAFSSKITACPILTYRACFSASDPCLEVDSKGLVDDVKIHGVTSSYAVKVKNPFIKGLYQFYIKVFAEGGRELYTTI